MTVSAISRRQATSHRIELLAQRLTDERGLDGWTMDELADAAGVSRRTLFNYFGGKVEAVLGTDPEPGEELFEQFRAGGPSGDLLEDLQALVLPHFEARQATREDLARVHRLLKTTPRLLAAAHERFHGHLERFVAEIETREGADFDPIRAHVAVSLLAALFGLTLEHYTTSDDDELSFSDTFVHALRVARGLLA